MNNYQPEVTAVSVTDAAAQSIATASSTLDKPDSGAITKVLTFVRPRLEYIDHFRQFSRAPDVMAKVFSYLVYHAQRNKPGLQPARLSVIREGKSNGWGDPAYWWLTTYEDLARACSNSTCKVTAKQAETAVKALGRAGHIECRPGRHPINGAVPKYRGKTVLHVRLAVCARSNGLDAWPTIEQMAQMRIVLGIPKGDPIGIPKGDPLLLDALVVKTLDSLEVNIQDANSLTLFASLTPDCLGISGEGKTPNKEKASEPFLKICLSKKLEFIEANDNGENTPCVLHELTPEDRNTAQRLEYELAKAGIDPLAFMNWLTLPIYQKVMLWDLNNAAHWSLFVLMSHREMFVEKYRAYLDSVAFYTLKKPSSLKAKETMQQVTAPPVVKLSNIAQLVSDKAPEKAAKQPTVPTAETMVAVDTPATSKSVTEAVSAPECPPLHLDAHVPPSDYDEYGYTYQEKLDAMKNVLAKPALPPTPQSNMFPHGKPKSASTAAA